MATSTTTPQTPTLTAAPPSTPSPGNWRHPRADEIARRQKASTFTDSNLQKILWNGSALVTLLYASSHTWLQPLRPLTTLLCLLALYNIGTALRPLLRPPDQITDIPLTPTQRALLGLDPRATPPLTPGTQYVTPPRYPRSPTPRNVSPAAARAGGSTYSTPITNSPSFGREGSASPLWQVGGGAGRRSSYGTPSPLGPGNGVLGAPGTPSPTAGRGATVGLNNKWLYQRGRSASGSRYPSMYTGSTFVDY